MKITIPHRYRAGLVKFAALDADKLLALSTAIQGHGPVFRPTTMEAVVSEAGGLETSDARAILETLLSMSLATTQMETTPAVMARGACDSVGELAGLKPEAREIVEKALAELIAPGGTIAVTAKVLGVYTLGSTLVTGPIRVATDARPVFSDEGSATIDAVVVRHTLCIPVVRGRSEDELQVSLDEEDLDSLERAIARARDKHATLSANWARLDTQVISTGPLQEGDAQ